ncbi:MAG: hypothetical protein QG639_748 [Patescibacteria group bacterium]|nr:hypothetical protein [Patescibacteria group bacterium]
MENDKANREKRAQIDLVHSIIRKIRTTLNPEKEPPQLPTEPPLIDPFLQELYEFVKTTLPKNNYQQNIRARQLIYQFEAYEDLAKNNRLKGKETMETTLIENMRQFLRDRQR